MPKVGKQTQKIREKQQQTQQPQQQRQLSKNPQHIFNADLLKNIQLVTNQISGLIYIFSNEAPYNNFLQVVFRGVLEHKKIGEIFHQLEIIKEDTTPPSYFFCVNVLQPGNRLNRIVIKIKPLHVDAFLNFQKWCVESKEHMVEEFLNLLNVDWFDEKYVGFYQFKIVPTDDKDVKLIELGNMQSNCAAGETSSFNWRFLECLFKFKEKITNLVNQFQILQFSMTNAEKFELRRVIGEVMNQMEKQIETGEMPTKVSFEEILTTVSGAAQAQPEEAPREEMME